MKFDSSISNFPTTINITTVQLVYQIETVLVPIIDLNKNAIVYTFISK